ncbi:hypothetical protein P280DRAFT_553948 [Massarina eburnea CBS 473.64]|uniref:AA1-like domain-containing protein n=1 Tax=Massarina eburnea CBS 473.64 TaxID=1395130 RepID=A0A6A6RMI3_9PLEO|nr:hypothetical protein P280DRAFT_553948 [Massarina eburnea CBS 473.64]
MRLSFKMMLPILVSLLLALSVFANPLPLEYVTDVYDPNDLNGLNISSASIATRTDKQDRCTFRMQVSERCDNSGNNWGRSGHIFHLVDKNNNPHDPGSTTCTTST